MDRQAGWLDVVGAAIALIVMSVYAFTVMAPYFLAANTNPELIQLIDRNKGTVDTVTVAVVMFFFGASVGRSRDATTISTLASTAAVAQAALAPLNPEPAVVLEPGQSAVVAASPEIPTDGTVKDEKSE